jgi:hypothetical protein
MPIELKDVNEEDRLDFEKRLANYGLDLSSLINNELTTVPSTITPLYIGNAVQSKFSPIILKTSDFDQVNQWIGTPDTIADKTKFVADVPKPLRFENLNLRRTVVELPEEDALAKLKVEDLSSEHLDTIRKAAKAYIDGDSRKLKAFKPWIEKLFPVIDIHVWPFFNITVKSGSVLEFGPGAHVLSAYNLTIEKGGLVRCYGHLKVDAVIIEKTEPFKFIELSAAVLESIRTVRQ